MNKPYITHKEPDECRELTFCKLANLQKMLMVNVSESKLCNILIISVHLVDMVPVRMVRYIH